MLIRSSFSFFFFFFNDTATTEIYTLSLHDALPICFASEKRKIFRRRFWINDTVAFAFGKTGVGHAADADRKSTRLNSSHGYISYAVFCLKKKKKTKMNKLALYAQR